MVTLNNPGGAPSIQELMAGVNFPVSRDELIESLQEKGASEGQLASLRAADTDRFDDVQQVFAALRGA